VKERLGDRTCDDPCILGRVLDNAFVQARDRLSCSDSVIYTGYHAFRRHASTPRAAADGFDCTLVRFPREFVFSIIIWPNSSFGALREASPPGYATRKLFMGYRLPLSFTL